ncbi:uncharacterized protein CBL_04264 [Carabus blaptoides fortunei]
MSIENQIILNSELITQKLNDHDFNYCIELLKEEFKLKRNNQNKPEPNIPSNQTIQIIGNILAYLSAKISNAAENNTDYLLLAKQCFQSLRNSSVCGEQIQNLIVDNKVITDNSHRIFKAIVNKNDVNNTDCLKMELQFLCNVIVSNEKAQILVWNKFSDLLIEALSRPEAAHLAVLVIYNILKLHNELLPNNVEFVCTILSLYSDNIDNVPLLLELLICKNVISNVYNDLDSELRLTLLENIYSMMIDDSIVIPCELIRVFVQHFKRKSDCILKTVVDYLKNIEPIEIARLLDCISSASSKELYLPILQEDKSLLINCAFLLKSIHDIGKIGDNHFSSIQKLSEINNANTAIQEHPGFGFKAALIRLLGNLCWDHKANQNLIRELDCIALLMDCCNIDARNPLIIQWVILAMRNLCKDNLQNQTIIAQMSKVGVVDSATLREMGLTLHDDGTTKIGIAPLNLNK